MPWRSKGGRSWGLTRIAALALAALGWCGMAGGTGGTANPQSSVVEGGARTDHAREELQQDPGRPSRVVDSRPRNAISTQRRMRLTKVHHVRLTWRPAPNGADDPQILGYNIFRCALASSECLQINAEVVELPEFIDADVRSGETYYYATTAVNRDGQQSALSNVVRVTIPFP